jgi:hypothetical protein
MGDKPVFYAGDDPFRFDEGYGTPEEGIPLIVNVNGKDRVTRWYITGPDPDTGPDTEAEARRDRASEEGPIYPIGPDHDWVTWYNCPHEPMYGNPDRELVDVSTTRAKAELAAVRAFNRTRASCKDSDDIKRACYDSIARINHDL